MTSVIAIVTFSADTSVQQYELRYDDVSGRMAVLQVKGNGVS